MKINKNRIPLYIMLGSLGYFIVDILLIIILLSYTHSNLNSNIIIAGVVEFLAVTATPVFYLFLGLLVIYVLRAIILFLITGKWWK